MNVNWQTYNGNWYSLELVDLASNHFNKLSGVYIIFTNLHTFFHTLDVGLGDIRTRLQDHRRQFQNRNDYGNIKVTWAHVPANSQGGVENYLRQQLEPSTGQRFSNDPPIPVNLPW